jgi:hypothetical protein
MTKPVIVTRVTKGSPLTRTELDNNFTNINDATIGLAGDAGTPISASLNDTITINGGNGIGTAVVDGDLVVNLNGVYGGDATSSTTVGNNTAVLLATVATSGSYNDLTNKPSIPSLPSQTGNSGKFLTTNGSATSWGTAGAGGLQTAWLTTEHLWWDYAGVNTGQTGQSRSSSVTFTIQTDGGITGLTVKTGGFSVPAGSYMIEIPMMAWSNSSNVIWGIHRTGVDGGNPALQMSTRTQILGGTNYQIISPHSWYFTTNSTQEYIFVQATNISDPNFYPGYADYSGSNSSTTDLCLFKITKLA